jgi:hypothetical protein
MSRFCYSVGYLGVGLAFLAALMGEAMAQSANATAAKNSTAPSAEQTKMLLMEETQIRTPLERQRGFIRAVFGMVRGRGVESR